MSGRQPEETWTDTIHNAINTTSEAVHRAVDAITGATSPGSSETPTDHPFVHQGTTSSGTTGSSAESFTPKPAHGETTTGMNVGDGTSFGVGKTEFSNEHPNTSSTASAGKTEYSNQPTDTSGSSTTGSSADKSSGSPTLTEAPSSTSLDRSDPNPSGPAQGGTDSSQKQPDNPSSSLPPPQTSGPGSATARGDAPKATNKSESSQRQVNKGEGIGSTEDEKSRLSGTTQGGAVSMSGTDTSHPGAGATPAAGAPAPVGDPSSGQGGKTDKQGGESPLKEPPKSEEDAKDPGTGQQYVKSSGVAAEGGDFDAAKPGAAV
jgi:hypothetical protein